MSAISREVFELFARLVRLKTENEILKNANAGLAEKCRRLQDEISVLKTDLHHGRAMIATETERPL